MSRQILNRREDVYVNETPPEILTEAKLSEDGYVKNTDYATTTGNAGVIKTSSSYGTSMTSTGNLIGVSKTLDAYNSGYLQMFICKGTLENVFIPKLLAYLVSIAPGYDASEVGTKFSALTLEKTADGAVLKFEGIAPPEPTPEVTLETP